MSQAPNYRCEHCRSTARQCWQEEGRCCHACAGPHLDAVGRIDQREKTTPTGEGMTDQQTRKGHVARAPMFYFHEVDKDTAVEDVGGIAGPHAIATRINVKDHPIPGDATVALWHVRAPEQSIGWENYALCVVHLRDEEGVDPPKVVEPGATHEFILMALYPGEPDEEGFDTDTAWKCGEWRPMNPYNFVGQYRLEDDEQAAHVAMAAVSGMCSGILWAEPPLSGQTEPWHSSLDATIKHYRGECDCPDEHDPFRDNGVMGEVDADGVIRDLFNDIGPEGDDA